MEVDISMTRDAALKTATERVATLKLAPADARSAVRFNNDSEAQNFIELEGGGKEAFNALLKQDIYQTLQWEVRFFREKDAGNTTLFFTPQGKPYGFSRHIPETDPGAALDAEQARKIAEAAALRDWNLDLGVGKSPFVLAEQSFEKRPGGRIDHAFVYERNDQKLGKNGEGRVRLTLEVNGDQLAELRYSIKVPQSFERRFAEMRATNNTIAGTASLAMSVLYLFGGCMLGLIWLNRQRFILLRGPLKWATFIALLQGAQVLNQIPSNWFSYDTAISTNAFIGQQIGMALAAFLGMWLLLTVSFIAAESLSRRAFGDHPQFWRLWTRDGAGTTDVLGRTMGGYLWVGFDLLFIVVFYYVTQNYLGWWSPLESLIDPNILATPMPWLAPVANSLQAGFWEECLFRAVPLAGAALIGDYLGRRFDGRYGGRRSWLIIGLVVQAVIFGAAHANYAQQPSYARPVELFIPALMWGIVYLRFGLLPGIVFHFVFDLLLMSLPIFAISAPGLELDRAIVVVCGAAPLLVVLWARWRAGQWRPFPPHLLNAAWAPKAPAQAQRESIAAATMHASWPRIRAILPWLGAAGVAGWIAFAPFKQDGLPFNLDRATAEAAADAALKARGVNLTDDWQRFSQVVNTPGEADAFVWREGGAKAYAEVLGRYLPPPSWRVRYVRFDGDVAERAEEWQVFVENGIDGRSDPQAKNAAHIRGIWHELPEARAGKSLTVEQARTLVHDVIVQKFGRQPQDLREISAIETKQPNRKDWSFTFADDKITSLKGGEARMEIDIAGDEVSLSRRFVHVPEAWERAERDRRALMKNVQIGVGLLSVLLGLGALIVAIIHGSQDRVDRRQFIRIGAGMFILSLLNRINDWQTLAMNFKTEQSLASQLGLTVTALMIGLALLSLIIGLFAGLGVEGARRGQLGSARLKDALLPGLSLAAFLVGLSALLSSFTTPKLPRLESLSGLNTAFPALDGLISGFTGVAFTLAGITFLLILLRDFNAGFTQRRGWTIGGLFVVGFIPAAIEAPLLTTFLMQGAVSGVVLVLLYVFVARFEPKVLLIALIAKSVFAAISTIVIAPYPNVFWIKGLQILALLLATAWWMHMLDQAQDRQLAKGAPADAVT